MNIFRKMIANCLGFLFFLLIIVGLAGLFKFLYFPSKTKAVPEDKNIDKFSKTIDRPREAGHFHLLDESVFSDEENATICLKCHGNFCHKKSKDFRAYYNMHTFYIACETCHIRKKEGEKIVFKWFDDKSGDVVKELIGSAGNYGAKIVPVKAGQRLDKFPEEELAIDFMKNQDTYTEEEKKKIQDQLMQHISKEPVACRECHQRRGYLNFKKLGYVATRSDELSGVAIVKMLLEYEEFYLPDVFH